MLLSRWCIGTGRRVSLLPFLLLLLVPILAPLASKLVEHRVLLLPHTVLPLAPVVPSLLTLLVATPVPVR